MSSQVKSGHREIEREGQRDRDKERKKERETGQMWHVSRSSYVPSDKN